MSVDKKFFKVTLVKSLIGSRRSHKLCAFGLGIRKIGQSRVLQNTSSNRGMARKISYMVKINEVDIK